MKTEDLNKLSSERMGKLITLLKPDAPVDLVIDVVKEYSNIQNKELIEALEKSHERTLQFYTRLSTLIDEDGLSDLRGIMTIQQQALNLTKV